MRKWMPISTAPRDGTSVLVYGPRRDGGTYIDVCPYYMNEWTVIWMDNYEEPTHWMPLPEPPTGEE